MKNIVSLVKITMMSFILANVGISVTQAESLNSLSPEYGLMQEGSLLGGTPSYQWWYGCSPTAAGMLMGYYDIKGYGGLRYGDFVPGGVAEADTFPSTAGTWDYFAQSVIASAGHVNAFYRTGYNTSGDDIASLHTSYDSLADFMGTSQDKFGNVNGSTSFYYNSDGSRLYAKDIYNYNKIHHTDLTDGMYGIWQYEIYSGYGNDDPSTDTSVFTQLTDNQKKAYGYTFADYKAEIDAGREVMIHVKGHSMVGYGYDDNNLVYLYDTWSPGLHSMTWGGSYSGLEMWGVTSFTPTGGSPVPIPLPAVLLSSGITGLVWLRRKGRA